MKIFLQNIVSVRFVELLNYLIDSKSIQSKSKFALSLGIKPQTLSEITAGRRDITLESIRKLFITYPNVETEWLLKGNGRMLKENSIVNIVGTNNKVSYKSGTIDGAFLEKKYDTERLMSDYEKEIESLKAQLLMKDDLIKSKEETIELLKRMLK